MKRLLLILAVVISFVQAESRASNCRYPLKGTGESEDLAWLCYITSLVETSKTGYIDAWEIMWRGQYSKQQWESFNWERTTDSLRKFGNDEVILSREQNEKLIKILLSRPGLAADDKEFTTAQAALMSMWILHERFPLGDRPRTTKEIIRSVPEAAAAYTAMGGYWLMFQIEEAGRNAFRFPGPR